MPRCGRCRSLPAAQESTCRYPDRRRAGPAIPARIRRRGPGSAPRSRPAAARSRSSASHRAAPESRRSSGSPPAAPEDCDGAIVSTSESQARQLGQRPSIVGLTYPHCWQTKVDFAEALAMVTRSSANARNCASLVQVFAIRDLLGNEKRGPDWDPVRHSDSRSALTDCRELLDRDELQQVVLDLDPDRRVPANRLSSRPSASGSSIRFWMIRRSGRAP